MTDHQSEPFSAQAQGLFDRLIAAANQAEAEDDFGSADVLRAAARRLVDVLDILEAPLSQSYMS